MVRQRKGEFKKELDGLLKQGFQRVKIDGEVYDLEDAPALEKTLSTTLRSWSTVWWSRARRWRSAWRSR